MNRVSQPFTGVVRHLIIINVLMYIGTLVLMGEPVYNMDYTDIQSLGRLQLAVFIPGSEYFQPYQIATHMFMHANFSHLLFNMMALYFFGPMIEMVWGERRFLFYYLFCGIGAFAIHTGVQWWELSAQGIDPTTASLYCSWGASGAVFGILAAYAYLFPNNIVSLLFPPISLKAKYFVLIYAGIELMSGVSGVASGVAHFAHVGGALCGYLLILYWYKFR
jgi:membrane associated rhomboid family serine protease